MNPLSINRLGLLAGAALAAAIGFGAGWEVNGWRKDAGAGAIQVAHEKDRADRAQAALNDLASAARSVRAAADGYTADSAALGVKLEQLRKGFKNAKPLPAGCRPDDFRVRHLGAAVDAANKAAAGQ